MRSTLLSLSLFSFALLSVTPVLAGDAPWQSCQSKPTAQCLANLSFAIGKSLPEQEASRYRLAEQRARDNLRQSLDALLADEIRPPSALDSLDHMAAMGDLAKIKSQLAELTNRSEKAQAFAILAAAEALQGQAQNAHKHLRRAWQLAAKLKGADQDAFARRAAMALIEMGSDDKALEAVGTITDPHNRAFSLMAMAQRQWERKHTDAAHASLLAAENTPSADLLAIARMWRLFGDEEGYSRALQINERQNAHLQSTADARDLSDMVVDLNGHNDLMKLHDRISRLPDPQWRAHALVSLANRLPPQQAGDAGAFLYEAVDLVSRMNTGAMREDLTAQLVHSYALSGDRQQAAKLLAQVKDSARRAQALMDLAGLTAPHDKNAAQTLFHQAEDEIDRQTNRQEQDLAFRDLIWAERRAGLDDLAAKVAPQIHDPEHHLLSLAQIGDWANFDRDAKSQRPNDHDLQLIAAGHAMDGRFSDVLETIRRIGAPSLQAESLAAAAALSSMLAP